MRMIRMIALVASGAALSMSAACGGGNGARAAQTQRSGVVSLANGSAAIGFETYQRLGYRMEWKSQPVMRQRSEIRFFDVFGGEVVVHDTGNIISVMEKTTGSVRWSDKLGDSIVRYVGNVKLDDGRLLTSSETEARIIDVRTGELQARQQLAALANTKPNVVGNIAVYGCSTGEVLGHNLVSGYKQWGHKLDESINAGIASNGTRVAAVSRTGRVAVLAARRGRLVSATKMYSGTEVDPAMSNDGLYLAGLDQSVWAFDLLTGEDLWRVRTGSRLVDKPVFHGRTVYVSLPDRGFSALRSRDGKVKWSAAGVAGEAVAVRDGRLLVWDGSVMTTLDLDDGAVIERVELAGVSHVVADGFADGDLYLAWSRGPVVKLSPR